MKKQSMKALSTDRATLERLQQRIAFRIRAARTAFILLAALMIGLPLVAWAQAGPMPVITSWQDVVAYAIPIIVPLLIALTKKAVYVEVTLPNGSTELTPPAWLPSWTLPILAPVVGMVVAWIATLAGAPGVEVWVGAVLGALGVYVREVTKPITSKFKSA